MSQSSGSPRTDNDPFYTETQAARGAHVADPLVVPDDGAPTGPATGGGFSGRDGVGTRDSSNRGGGAKDEAKEQGRQVAGDAKNKGREVAGTAKDKGQEVADDAKAKASQVKDEAKDEAKGLLDSARSELNDQASTQTKRAQSTLSSLGDQIASLANGDPQDGQVTDLVRQAGDKVSEAARWMDGREPSDLLQDVARFARRRPGAFLAIAAGVGILAGRFTRGAAADAKDDSDSTSAPSASSHGATGSGYSTGSDFATTSDFSTESDFSTDASTGYGTTGGFDTVGDRR